MGLNFYPSTQGSCALLRYVRNFNDNLLHLLSKALLYLSPQPWSDSSVSNYHHKNSMLTTYNIHYDNYYTEANPSSLMSFAEDQFYLAYPSIISVFPWTDAQYHTI